MDDESIKKQWNSSTSFILVMVGAIIALAGVWRFSYLIYENGGGSFLIPYILAIVIMVIPLLVLEIGVGFKYRSSLPKLFYNIKSEFEIVAWLIIFLIFIVLIYYTCIMSWDLMYLVLSLFKGWGNNPSVFFTNTLLHSTSNPYGLTYLVVPIGIGLISIWALIYFISRREINKGISLITKFSLALTFILVIVLSVFALQLPGSRTGLMALFNPNWEYLLDYNIWLSAFGQLVFSYGLAYGIASTYSSYLPEDAKLVDSAWVIVLISLVFEILMSILIFALLGYMALGKNIPITSLVSDGYSLIFVVFPNVFNVMGSWATVVGPLFFLVLFIGGLGALFALIAPLANAICEKFMWDKDRTIKTLALAGLFASFLFATGMGEYLLRIVDNFITQFAIILAVLLELIVFGWIFDIDDIRNVLNDNSRIKLAKYWVYLIRFVIPIILLVIWILGVYNLIVTGDRQSLLIQSILASIIVLVPLALTVLPFKGDYSIDSISRGYNYFRDSEDGDGSKSRNKSDSDSSLESKSRSESDSDSSLESKSRNKSDSDSSSEPNSKSEAISKFKSRFTSRFVSGDSEDSDNEKTYVEKTIDDFEDYDSNENRKDKSKEDLEDDADHKSIFSWDKFKKSKNGKNVLNNVDLSAKEFDPPSDDDYDDFNSFDEDYSFEDVFDDFDYITPIREESPNVQNNNKKHKFRSSADYDGIETLDDLSMDLDGESSEKPDSKPKRKSSSKKKSSSKSKSKSEAESKKGAKSKKGSNSNKVKESEVAESKLEEESTLKEESESTIEEAEEIEYDDFSDDFFDDGIFGDEGYEALLDDYVPPKAKSKKKNKESSSESNQSSASKDSKPYYDYEKKGSDSVFNLDD